MAVSRNSSAVFPVGAPFNTATPASGNFIPSVWSAKLNAKFYASTVFGEIANTNWQGEISGMGDKVIINTAPTITVTNYTVGGGGLNYQVPQADVQEMLIDKAKAFAFQINDVLDFQAKPNLLDMFSADAGEQMKIAIDSTVLFNTVTSTTNGPAAANMGATAGAKSGAYSMGIAGTPIAINATAGDAANVLTKILQLSSILDEQNVPESDRFLLIDPATRVLLMNTNLAQAQFMGDSQSIVRNGKIGMIDRFTVYVTNQLPYAAANATVWTSADGSETSGTITTNAAKRRVIVAGHKTGLTFASQITKMETIRNPNDFGDYIRSLNVFGYRTVKPEALALCIVS
jgi:hypothetical protein